MREKKRQKMIIIVFFIAISIKVIFNNEHNAFQSSIFKLLRPYWGILRKNYKSKFLYFLPLCIIHQL